MWQCVSTNPVGLDQSLEPYLQVGPGFGVWIAHMACTLLLTPAMAFWSAAALLIVIVLAEIACRGCVAVSGGVAAGMAAQAQANEGYDNTNRRREYDWGGRHNQWSS